MRLPGIRLVEQTEQKFRRFESVLKKKTSDGNSRGLLLIKASTKNVHFHTTHNSLRYFDYGLVNFHSFAFQYHTEW